MVTASAPGKIMLAGEYAVLLGGRALSVTVDRRLAVTATMKPKGYGARITSDLWPEARTLSDAAVAVGRTADGDPLTTAAAYGMKAFGIEDVELIVTSELRVSHGIGSSSALRLAVLMALNALAPEGRRLGSTLDVARHAWLLQREAQALASGYDVATQLTGGLVEFRNPAARRPMIASPVAEDSDQWPVEITRHERLIEPARELVHPFVGGRGAPTGKVTIETLAWLDQQGRLEPLLAASEDLVDAFHSALAERFDAHAQSHLIACVREHRSLFEGSPHDPSPLRAALMRLPGFDHTWSFKTTGAGGEDAILLIGEPTCLALATDTLYRMGWDRLSARLSSEPARVGERDA